MNEIIDLGDPTPRSARFRIGGVDYTLRGATAKVSRDYRNSIARAGKMIDGKVVGVSGGIADGEPEAVAASLFNGDDKPISLETVLGFACEIQHKLFDWLRELSPSMQTGITEQTAKN